MYLKRIYDENVGPIEKLNIELSFTEKGNPKPTVFVGENGSGKSILLSNIVDAFYEISSVAYSDSKVRAETGDKIHFKGLSSNEIKIGHSHLLSYLNFFDPEHKVSVAESIFKMGKLNKSEIEVRIQQNLVGNYKLKDTGHYKKHSASTDFAEKMFGKDIICYFPPSRYALPSWHSQAYSWEGKMSNLRLSNKENGSIHNNIIVTGDSEENIAWLLDVIIDSRTEIFPFLHKISGYIAEDTIALNVFKFKTILEKVDSNIRSEIGLGIATYFGENFDQNAVLHIARENTEKILSEILGEDVYFDLQARNHFGRRFCIKKMNDDSIYVSNIKELSTGQLALLNMFISIIRYSDRNNIGTSIQLEQISGIVVIDEIELHLHAKLQREVLPKLIKLMPKVQFIITSHSPLFLLGMREEFWEDGFDIYEMPTGTKKNAEDFSEFQLAYDYMKETTFHREQIAEELSKYQEKTLVITEGGSDWIHMTAALNHFSHNEEFQHLEIEFFKYYSNVKWGTEYPIFDMGDSALITMCKNFSRVPQTRTIIFIADRDKRSTIGEFSSEGADYKDWGNGVYSTILPIPHHREGKEFSIEHYYTDEEIKTNYEESNVSRRLYIGNEFNEGGYNDSEKLICEKRDMCGSEKIHIMDGSKGFKVRKLPELTENVALTKMQFAQNILNKTPPFDNFDFSSFRKLFEIIEEICSLP